MESYASLIGAVVVALILSGLVGLIAINKNLGYLKAFVISFLAGIVFILLDVPFNSLISSLICAVIFLFLPKKTQKPV